MTNFRIDVNGKEMIFSEQEMKRWFPKLHTEAIDQLYKTYWECPALTIKKENGTRIRVTVA